MIRSFSESLKISEYERICYLQALEVPLWVPKEQADDEFCLHEPAIKSQSEISKVADIPAQEAKTAIEAKNSVEKASVENAVTNSDAQVALADSYPAPESNQKSVFNQPHQQQEVNSNLEVGFQNNSARLKNTNKHFVKVVNWRVTVESTQDTSKQDSSHLLIVCRHQTDQPAQSFAKANSPSLFMQDYILALQGLISERIGTQHAISIGLGHLSEAGLSHNCELMQDVIQQQSPQLIFMLGDEAVKKVLGEKETVSSVRGKIHQAFNGTNILVSYHPYTLIKNPELKKLALEDLKLVAHLMTSAST